MRTIPPCPLRPSPGGPSGADRGERLPASLSAAGSGGRAPRTSLPCGARRRRAPRAAPEAGRAGPRQAERRGSRMTVRQRRGTAAFSLALGLLAVAQVRGPAGRSPASPGRGSPLRRGSQRSAPAAAPPRPAGTCRRRPQLLPAGRAAGGSAGCWVCRARVSVSLPWSHSSLEGRMEESFLQKLRCC